MVVFFLGVDVSSMHAMKIQRPSTMLSDVRQLVASGGSLNQPNEEGITLVCKSTYVLGRKSFLLHLNLQFLFAALSLSLKLHIACASGYREVVSVLLQSGADPHPADNNFWTPLHLAAKYGQVTHSCTESQHVMDVD